MAKFAADPKRLRISATAPNGLGVADFALFSNPAALLEKLSVSASANDRGVGALTKSPAPSRRALRDNARSHRDG